MFFADGMKAAKSSAGGWCIMQDGEERMAFASRDQARKYLREIRATRQAILAKSASAFSSADPSNLTS